MSVRNFDGTFRLTPFRTAIARRLVTSDIAVDSPNHSTADDPVRDLLGMTELRDRARRAFKEWWTAHGSEIATAYEPALREFCRELFFWTSADRFFAAMSDADLYCPVSICLAHDRHRTWEDLTDLLLKTAGDSHGLLISARSGGGKTVGSWCAWFRCFSDRAWIPYPDQPGTNRLAPALAGSVAAPLAGFLPVWIDVADSALPEGNEDDFILKIIARQCLGHLSLNETAQLRLLERYLQLGAQKFLLFFDLNHAPAEVRSRYAEALIRFQNRYGPDLGHRCIVIYRAAGQEDKVLHNLTHQGTRATQFVEYDLLPLDDEVAIDYLARIRKVENDLFDHLDLWLQDWSGEPNTRLPRSEHDPDTELSHLKRLLRIRRRAAIRQRGTDDDLWEQETVISIPLLMHWVSTFPPEVLDRIKTLSDIYAQLTRQHLQREEADRQRALTRLSSDDLLIAMQRLALAILAQQGETRLSVAEAKRLLTRPQGGNTRIPVRRVWMPMSELLTQSLTYSRVFTKEEVAALFELGLLRKTDDSLGFAHDSLIYYFSARALREYEGIGLPSQDEPLEDAWPQAISETFLEDPARWLLVAEFLGEMIQTRDHGSSAEVSRHNQGLLRQLVSRLVTFWPDMPRDEAIESMQSVPELVSRLCSTQPHDRVLRQVYQATNDHSRFAWEHPHLLLQEVMNRCRWFGAPGNEVEQWSRQLDEFRGDDSIPRKYHRPQWLKKRLGLRSSDTLTIEDAHTESINSLAVFKGPDGPRIITAGDDNRIAISDPRTGQVEQTITGSHSRVAVYDGQEGLRIVSAVGYGQIVISNLHTGEVELFIDDAHSGPIVSIAVYESLDGSRIISAGDDNRIVISDPYTGELLQVIEEIHSGIINCMAVYESLDGPRIISAGQSGQIVISDPRTGELEQTIENAHMGIINCMVVIEFPEGPRIVSGGNDNWIAISDLQTGEVKQVVKGTHSGDIYSLAMYESSDGLRVVSAGEDGQIVICDPRTGQVEQIISKVHAGCIECLAVYERANGPHIVSAGKYGQIVISDLKTGQVGKTNADTDPDWICCMATYEGPDGLRVVSAGQGRRIVISDPQTGLVERIIEEAHKQSIKSLAVYDGPNGPQIASTGFSGDIFLINPNYGEVEQILTDIHIIKIDCIAVFECSDGPRIISSGRSHRYEDRKSRTKLAEQTSKKLKSEFLDDEPLNELRRLNTFSLEWHSRTESSSVRLPYKIVISNPCTGQVERTIEGRGSNLGLAVYKGPDGPRIVTVGDYRNRIVISNLLTEEVEQTIEESSVNLIQSMAVFEGPEGPRIVLARRDGKTYILDLEEILTWRGDNSIFPQPINTLFNQAQCIAIEQTNSRLICGVGKHLEVYEFVTL